MFIFSKKTVQFINEIKGVIKDVLSRKVGLKVSGERFYDREGKCSYPIKVVIYNNKSMLGYFDPNFYELGFNECLMHVSRDQLHNVIQHELAHYITIINHGETFQPHSPEFKAFCLQMGWGEEVYRASTCLEGGLTAIDVIENDILRKVQKLMALTNSSNKNEAEQAMIKAQQLLLKHNIETRYIGMEEGEQSFLKRILKQKKENAKMRAIARILETFFVVTVFNRTDDFTCLEILGDAVNVEIAEYVAGFLEVELDKLWARAQRETRLKGMRAKNSFFLGIAKGYCDKIEALKRSYTNDVTQTLMVIEKKLADAQAMAYRRLSFTKSNSSCCPKSAAFGELMGRQLNIHPAVDRATSNKEALITFSG